MAPAHTVELPVFTVVLTGVSSCLSILGAIAIFSTYWLIPEIRNFTRQLLVYLTIADLLTAVGNLVATIRYALIHENHSNTHVCKNLTSFAGNQSLFDANVSTVSPIIINTSASTTLEGLCEGQSFVTTFSNMSSFFWTFFIAFHMFVTVVFQTDFSQRKSTLVTYHVFSWAIPVTIVAVVYAKGYLGADYCFGTGVWCGIKSDLDPAIIEKWMYIADVAWQVPCYWLTCTMYMFLKLYVFKRYSNAKLHTIQSTLRDEDKNFLFVWLIIYLLKLWGLVRFFVTTYTPTEILAKEDMKTFLKVLLNLQSFGASGQAFFNSLLFCVCDATVRKKITSVCRGGGEEEERRSLISTTSINA